MYRVTVTGPSPATLDFETYEEAASYVSVIYDTMDPDEADDTSVKIRSNLPGDAIVEGNPGPLGPGADPLDVIIEEGENITVTHEDGESLVSWDEDGERHTVLVDEAGSLTHWDSQGLVSHEPGKGVTDGNPGGEPLHESLAEIATDVAYEAEVVAAAAEVVEDDGIAAAAEDQAEAMDAAAEALDEAAEVAAEVAADVFIETGTPTVEVADTDSPEGEIVSGEIETEAEAVAAEIVDDIEEVIEDAVADIPPEPQHWYKRRWARV